MGRLRFLLVMVMVAGLGAAAQGPAHLAGVLTQMDAASARFQSAEADFQWDFFERVTRSTSTQTGTIFFQREKDGATEMGAKMMTPEVKLLSYKDGLLQVLDPKSNTLIKISAHGNNAQYESFLTLGFGGSGRDLESKWTITDQGMATVDGVSTAKLDLVSKDANVRTMFTHVTIWVDPSRGVLLRQEFFTPSDDKRTAIYTHIRYNQRVEKKPYEIKANSKTNVTTR